MAFERGVKEVKSLLKNCKEKAKIIHMIKTNLKVNYPDKGMEWHMLEKALECRP